MGSGETWPALAAKAGGSLDEQQKGRIGECKLGKGIRSGKSRKKSGNNKKRRVGDRHTSPIWGKQSRSYRRRSKINSRIWANKKGQKRYDGGVTCRSPGRDNSSKTQIVENRGGGATRAVLLKGSQLVKKRGPAAKPPNLESTRVRKRTKKKTAQIKPGGAP